MVIKEGKYDNKLCWTFCTTEYNSLFGDFLWFGWNHWLWTCHCQHSATWSLFPLWRPSFPRGSSSLFASTCRGSFLKIVYKLCYIVNKCSVALTVMNLKIASLLVHDTDIWLMVLIIIQCQIILIRSYITFLQ